ncbi:hypothetical protein HBZC1_17330 [Helicobacter bizzozeronii CIII-1]|uniref:Uncharacterized protein n=1 Tax=Helicobacter bizzozeronii (strain CIII-1) TaxID=1002804 RepID=F8KPJ5_HELBC|nr:hypothetical protein HBZC1_17330 [Helicobacter bizzozeronii CIII-1]
MLGIFRNDLDFCKNIPVLETTLNQHMEIINQTVQIPKIKQ